MLDYNVPQKLRRLLTVHDVKKAEEMGWAELENGELLRAWEAEGFLVMVTADKNLSYQQNLRARKLALVMLSTKRWKVLREHGVLIAQALEQAQQAPFDTSR